MKKILIFFAIVTCTLCANAKSKTDLQTAETVRSIKLSHDTYWWDEIPLNLAELKKNPQQRDILRQNLKLNIGNQIKSYVYGSISVKETETDGYSRSNYNHSVTVSTNLYLNNVGYYEYNRDKKLYLFAYLKRSDFWEQENEQIAKINNVVAKAKQMEESGESDYLYPYYKAYLMSYNVTRSFAGINGEPDLQFWLENKLYSILRKIQIRSVVYPGTDNKTRPVELLVDSLALPSGLLIDIPSLGFHQLAVTDGKCKLFYDAQPSRRIDEHQICLAINPALMASEKEISELAEQRKIKVESRIQLDFSDLVKIDFTYLTDNLMVRFTPSFNNLSLSFVQWDLGDGSKARTAEAFEHVYPAGGEYLVSLVVNGEFTVTKTLQLKSVIPDISLPAIDKTSIDAPDSLFNTLDSSYGAIEVSDLAKPEIPELAPIISNPKPLVKEQTLSKADYIAKELLKCKNAPELLKYLDQQKAEHLLAYGKLKRDSALDNVWIVIMENDGMITAILQPQDDAFVDLLTKAIVSDVFATYRGKAAIYISYY